MIKYSMENSGRLIITSCTENKEECPMYKQMTEFENIKVEHSKSQDNSNIYSVRPLGTNEEVNQIMPIATTLVRCICNKCMNKIKER